MQLSIQLDDEDLRALTRYQRVLSLGGEAYWADVEMLPTLDIPRGTVRLQLPYTWDENKGEVWWHAQLDGRDIDRWQAESIEDNRVLVEGFPLVPRWTYQARAQLDGQEHRSVIFEIEDLVQEKPIHLFPYTNKLNALQLQSMAIQLMPVPTQEMNDFALVTQVFQFTNTSESLYADGDRFAWQLPLPTGISLLEIGSEARHGYDQEANSLFGKQPIMPGAGEVVGIQYLLPIDPLAVYEYPLPYGLNGALRILIAKGEWVLLGADLPLLGEEVINSRTYESYGLDQALPLGNVLRFGLGKEGSNF